MEGPKGDLEGPRGDQRSSRGLIKLIDLTTLGSWGPWWAGKGGKPPLAIIEKNRVICLRSNTPLGRWPGEFSDPDLHFCLV